MGVSTAASDNAPTQGSGVRSATPRAARFRSLCSLKENLDQYI